MQKGTGCGSSSSWLSETIPVRNRRGVHGRVATGLAEIARTHGVELKIAVEDRTIDCLSILDVLSQGIVCGTELLFLVRGEKGQAALQAVRALLSLVNDGQNDSAEKKS